MINIREKSNKIILVDFWFNLILFIIYLIKGLFESLIILVFVINLILLGTYLILIKYSTLFYGLSLSNSLVKSLSSKIDN